MKISGRSWGNGERATDARNRSMPRASLLAMVASTYIGFGDALTYGTYGAVSIVLVLLGAALVWWASGPGSAKTLTSEQHTSLAVGLVLAACVVAAIRFRGGLYASGSALAGSIVLVVTGATVAAVLVVRGRPRLALLSTILMMGGASIAMVIASPAPRIDVWEMYQAVGRGLLHGHNVYTQHWSPNIPHQATRYAYFPGSALLLTPFYAAFGDVRFGIICALILSAILIARISNVQRSAICAVLLLLFPYLTYSVEQSWSEPLTLLALLLMAWATKSGHSGWAVVALAVALTFQQYDLIFVPLAAAWPRFGLRRTAMSLALAGAVIAPWALAAPHAFVQGAFTYNLHYIFGYQSLSVFYKISELSTALAYAVLVVGVTVALVAGMRRLRNGGNFLMSCAVVIVTLNVVDKVSRFNEWELAAGLVLAAGAEALDLLPSREAKSKRWAAVAGGSLGSP